MGTAGGPALLFVKMELWMCDCHLPLLKAVTSSLRCSTPPPPPPHHHHHHHPGTCPISADNHVITQLTWDGPPTQMNLTKAKFGGFCPFCGCWRLHVQARARPRIFKERADMLLALHYAGPTAEGWVFQRGPDDGTLPSAPGCSGPVLRLLMQLASF